jgi:hypothetical protein
MDQDFALGINCQDCEDGHARVVNKNRTRLTICATVRPNPAKGIPRRCGRKLRVIREKKLEEGYAVHFRYVTKGRRFVLIRDPHIKNNRRGNWAFIHRSALKANLCGPTQNCDPYDNDPR